MGAPLDPMRVKTLSKLVNQRSIFLYLTDNPNLHQAFEDIPIPRGALGSTCPISLASIWPRLRPTRVPTHYRVLRQNRSYSRSPGSLRPRPAGSLASGAFTISILEAVALLLGAPDRRQTIRGHDESGTGT